MVERIGRVEFLVDLDGKNLPQQARALGERIGKQGGDAAGESFENSFDKRLSNLGKGIADSLRDQGTIAGERFSTSFDRVARQRFRRVQENLAEILSNKDAFADFAGGFRSVDEAVKVLQSDLDRLSNTELEYQDAAGETQRVMVLNERAAKAYGATLENMGRDLKQVNAEQSDLARDAEDLESSYARLVRSLGDGDSFRKVAAEVGGTEKAFERLSAELEDSGRTIGKSRLEIESYVDRLESTRNAVDKAIASEREHAKSLRGLGSAWSGLSHNSKQWTLIITAVAAAMQDLAVLGSAAGAGILGLGSALTTAVAGAGGFATVLTVLSKDLDELPPDLRRSATELRSFKDGFGDLGLAITRSAVAEMPDTFVRLERTTRALTPAFSSLGTSVGRTFDNMANGLEEGTAGFTVLEGVIENAADDLPALASATGTWLTALGRGLNEANPLADQLIGYIQELGDRFDAFTQSDGFDVWVKNSMDTFTDLGELLDSTGRMLNDLVTPAAVERTQAFLDNLTDFMPHLGNLLDFAGRLDVFGLAAQLLADWGEALEPLAEPMGELADATNDVASELISSLAPALEAAARVIAPVVEGAADLIDAFPPGVWAGATIAILGTVGALRLLKGAQALAGATAAATASSTALAGFSTAAGTAAAGAGRLRSGLKGLAGKAGLFGGLALGAGLAAESIVNAADAAAGFDDAARNVVAAGGSITTALEETRIGFDGLNENTADVLDRMGDLDNFFVYISALDGVGTEAVELATTLQRLSDPLAQLATTNLPEAQAQFRAYADELGATDQQVLNMLENMPAFKQTLLDSAAASGQLATDTDLVEMALGRETTTMGGATAALQATLVATDDMRTGSDLLTGSTDLLTGATDAETAAMNINRAAMNKSQSQTSSLEGAFDSLTGQTDVLSFAFDKSTGEINSWSDGVFDARGASRDFRAQLQQTTDTIAENEKTLDTNKEAGRENEAALDDLAIAALNNAEAIYRNTGSQEGSTQAIKDGRAALIEQLRQFGITGQEAEDYADSLGLIPADVSTAVAIRGAQAALNTIGSINSAINNAARDRSTNIHVTTSGVTKVGNREITFARGGEVYGPTRALIGEAGPEAVVPLRRPLSQVDPSVRWLSAIAQGKATPMAGGGVAGGGNQITIEAGAIVVQGAEDPRRTAIEVVDRIAESATS